ncbi:MAG: putative 4-hydroxybenzoate polyprenyltransferase [Verrucomicrobiae bacterium]|nr:putative 4-hydroxybenzoate polyprenyltransferase [Verrucomicrobiae bacterium]MDW8344329.1 UbiA-like polyprenyltransferase [Verrucomicrobiae bacterium]
MQWFLRYLEFIKFSHTVFALPFALAAVVVAARGWPGGRTMALVLAAMVCARTSAMAFNRIVDRKFDALNPRTRNRHLPTGSISLRGAWALTVVSAALFVGSAWAINPLCGWLSPVALVVIWFYSLTKRFTDFSHLFLGLALGLAPLGGWLAVTGRWEWPPIVLALAVVCWLTGFDIIYATQDYEFDKSIGLHSLPVRWGIAGSLQFARWSHAMMTVLLAVFGWMAKMSWPYYLGLVGIAGCLALEHHLARRRDPVSLNTAFFRMNAIVSVLFLAATVAGVWRA